MSSGMGTVACQKCLSRKWFIYTWVGDQYKSKCCSWILMWTEQIHYLPSATTPLKMDIHTFTHLLKTNLYSGYGCEVKTGIYCFKVYVTPALNQYKKPPWFSLWICPSVEANDKIFGENFTLAKRKERPPGVHIWLQFHSCRVDTRLRGTHSNRQKKKQTRKKEKKKEKKQKRKICNLAVWLLSFLLTWTSCKQIV